MSEATETSQTEAAPAAAEPASERRSDFKWYIVHVYSNFENRVATTIREEAATRGLDDCFEEILVPSEEVTEVRRGRKVTSEKTFYPGYVLVKMRLTDDAYHLVKNTPKVTGFLGADHGKKPLPVSEREVRRTLGQAEEGAERTRPTVTYEINEKVRVTDGPFSSFEGVVEEVDEERARLKVAVSIFGRATPVELDYTQVEKT